MINETRDPNGNLLFYVENDPSKKTVRDANGNLLGFVQNGQTRDTLGNLVLNGDQPGLLYKGPMSL